MGSTLDALLRYSEIFARQIYWRNPKMRSLIKRSKFRRRVPLVRNVDVDRLFLGISELLELRGGKLMIHSSTEGVNLVSRKDGVSPLVGSARVAACLVARFKEEIGTSGIVAMPTHPAYDGDREFFKDKSDTFFTYNVARTPSKVGMLSEVFRRSEGVVRSLHPLSSLACWGAGASELLSGNIGDDEPLPHGVSSGYYKFCRLQGMVISINVPLIKALTIVHCAEEVRDSEWPVRNFFYPRAFSIKSSGCERMVRVRERRPIWVRNISLGQLRRDLLKFGILKEHIIEGVRVDVAYAGPCYDYMMKRNSGSTYPYFGILTPKPATQ